MRTQQTKILCIGLCIILVVLLVARRSEIIVERRVKLSSVMQTGRISQFFGYEYQTYSTATNHSSSPSANVQSSCLCNGINFCYSTPQSKGPSKHGKRFNCSLIKYLPPMLLKAEAMRTTTAHSTAEQVFVTGASSNHWPEVLDQLGNLIALHGKDNNTRIIFYDLGLSPQLAEMVQQSCHVEYRKFNGSKYPPFVQSKLTEYRWKPLIMAELIVEFHRFWWADSSIRWATGNLTYVYDAIDHGTIATLMLIDFTGHSIYSATNPGTHTLNAMNAHNKSCCRHLRLFSSCEPSRHEEG